MRFDVRALNAQQVIEDLSLEAVDRDDLDKRLRDLQFVALSIRGRSASTLAHVFDRSGAKFTATLFSEELLALLSAGLSVVEAIDALLEKESSERRRVVLTRILQRLHEGLPLSASLRQVPNAFPPLFLGIVQAAEGTSDLPGSLTRYLEYRRRADALRAQLVSAAIYPAILVVAGISVALFLMGYVVPRFASVYETRQQALPWASRLLLSTGEMIGHNRLELGVMLAIGLACVALGARHIYRSGKLFDWATRVAGLGTRLRIIELSRLYMTLGMLLEGGIPIRRALDMVGAAVSASTARHLAESDHAIAGGANLSDAFMAAHLTTPIAVRMLRVGERSGKIGAMLRQSAQFYEEDTARFMTRFSKIFEPALMATIGILIGGIVILLYMPIFDLAGSIE
jgi:general secretion pathway protein F